MFEERRKRIINSNFTIEKISINYFITKNNIENNFMAIPHMRKSDRCELIVRHTPDFTKVKLNNTYFELQTKRNKEQSTIGLYINF